MPERSVVLFDVDGTLVDSNYLHVQAWRAGFRQAGVTVDDWRVHRAIGMDGDRLLDDLAGAASEAQRTIAKDVHSSTYAGLAGELRRYEGARPLLQALHDRGVLVVLATSAPPDELDRLREALDCDDLVDAVTNANDVEDAKPHPSIVQVALDRADVDADHAVLVGDAVWDGRAATRAGVPFVGVRTGGVGPSELRDAGAVEVYDDVGVLGDLLDTSPLARLWR